MKNSMAMFALSVLERKYPFLWQICFKKSKLSIEAEICKLDWLEYVESDGDFYFIFFRFEIPFLG